MVGNCVANLTNLPAALEAYNAILGLYAAGEVANGDFFSDIYPASGSAISMSVVFGREAGINASEYVK